MFSQEMELNIHVLNTRMKFRVNSMSHSTLALSVNDSWFWLRNTYTGQETPEPYHLNSCNITCNVLAMSSTGCNTWLLLRSPRNQTTIEENNISRAWFAIFYGSCVICMSICGEMKRSMLATKSKTISKCTIQILKYASHSIAVRSCGIVLELSCIVDCIGYIRPSRKCSKLETPNDLSEWKSSLKSLINSIGSWL